MKRTVYKPPLITYIFFLSECSKLTAMHFHRFERNIFRIHLIALGGSFNNRKFNCCSKKRGPAKKFIAGILLFVRFNSCRCTLHTFYKNLYRRNHVVDYSSMNTIVFIML